MGHSGRGVTMGRENYLLGNIKNKVHDWLLHMASCCWPPHISTGGYLK